MAYRPLTDIPLSIFGDGSRVLSGGRIYGYLTGTTTPTMLYADEDGAQAGYSVQLDSRGEPTTIKRIWLDTSITYKLVLKDANGVDVWTCDPVYGSGYPGGADLSVQIPSMEEVRASTVVDDFVTVNAFYAGGDPIEIRLYRSGTGTPTSSGASNISADLSNDVFCNAAGHCYKLVPNQRISIKMFGAKGDFNGTTGTDDTAFIQNAIDWCVNSYDTPTKAIPLFAEHGNFRITARIDVPPCLHIFGSGMYNGTSVTLGTLFWKTHDGVCFRFNRASSGTALYHNGGISHCWITGNGSSDTTSSRLIELGDSGNVNSNNGAWIGTIENVGFNNTYGYGVYSAHSQSWKIRKCFFRNTRYGVWYNTVSASAVIADNEFALTNAGLEAYAIVLLRGSLGGATGAVIRDNYIVSPRVGIWLSNQIGAVVSGNTIEGAGREAIVLTRNIPAGTADVSESGMLNGCKGCHIDNNSIINWNDDGGSRYGIQVSYSRNNYIGHNAYISPNASSAGAIGLTTDGTDPCEDNFIVQPMVDGNNSGTVPGWLASDTQWYYQVVLRQDGIKLGLNGYTGTRGAADRGHVFFDSNNCVRYWTGTEAHYFLVADDTLSGSAGAATGQYLAINFNGTTYKLALLANS